MRVIPQAFVRVGFSRGALTVDPYHEDEGVLDWRQPPWEKTAVMSVPPATRHLPGARP